MATNWATWDRRLELKTTHYSHISAGGSFLSILFKPTALMRAIIAANSGICEYPVAPQSVPSLGALVGFPYLNAGGGMWGCVVDTIRPANS